VEVNKLTRSCDNGTTGIFVPWAFTGLKTLKPKGSDTVCWIGASIPAFTPAPAPLKASLIVLAPY
jgi:hypothetical protein